MIRFDQAVYDGMYEHTRYLMLPDKLMTAIGITRASVIVRLQYCINSSPGRDHPEHGRVFESTWEELNDRHIDWISKRTLRRSCEWLRDNGIIDWDQFTHPSGRHIMRFWICDAYKPGAQNGQEVSYDPGGQNDQLVAHFPGNSQNPAGQNDQQVFHDPLRTNDGGGQNDQLTHNDPSKHYEEESYRKVTEVQDVPAGQPAGQNDQPLIEVYKDISIKPPVDDKIQSADDTFGAAPQGVVETQPAFSRSKDATSPEGRSAMWEFIHGKLRFKTAPSRKLMAKTTSVRQISSDGVVTTHDFDSLFERGDERFVKWLTNRLTYASGSNTITGYSVFVNFLLAQNDYNYVRYVESKMSNTGSVAIDISRELPDIPE